MCSAEAVKKRGLSVITDQAEIVAGYRVLDVLGYGANSTIFSVQDPKDAKVYALKRVVRKSEADDRFVEQMVNEYSVARQLDHVNIRRCLELKKKKVFFSLKEAYLLMEMVTGRNLFQERPTKLMDLVNVFIVVAEALHAMHKAGFLHADMKPNNIILTDEGNLKVIDLGQSCPIGTVKTRVQGTPDYIAPEQVRRRPLTAQTDMFNFGATMYWCVTDRYVPTLIPNAADDANADRTLYQANEFNTDLPHTLNAIIMDCLADKPIDRPESMQAVRDRLSLAVLKLNRDLPTYKA